MKIRTITAERAAEKFQFLAFNRPISPTAVKDLELSIERNGVIRPVTIIATSAIEGKRGWYVADGQHLLTALERRGEDVPYVELKVDDMEDIYSIVVELNTTAKSWYTGDYVRLWAASGIPEYQQLQELYFKSDLTYAQLCVCLTGNRRSSNDVKHGNLKFFRKAFGLKMVSELDRLKSQMFMNSDIALGYYEFRRAMKKEPFDFDNMIAKITHLKGFSNPKIGNSSYQVWKETFEKIWNE